MGTKKKYLAFTIAFGHERYLHMAKTLERTIKKNSPETEFVIFTDNDFTPLNEGLPSDRKLFPKDYKFPKFEVMSNLSDDNTTYMFLDADTLVFEDLTPYFSMVPDDSVMIEYVYCGESGWAGIEELQFYKAAAEAGISGVEPYSINSGFIVWKGHQKCFSKALELIKSTTIHDYKGRKGDEYYLCSALQITETNVVPIDYSKVLLGKFWNGKISVLEDRVVCSAYPENDRMIVHYGNSNYDNPAIKHIAAKFYNAKYDLSGWMKYKKKIFKSFLKSIYKHVF